MFEVWLTDTDVKIALSKNNTLNVDNSSSVKQGCGVGGGHLSGYN
jgi:hypothetical protein